MARKLPLYLSTLTILASSLLVPSVSALDEEEDLGPWSFDELFAAELDLESEVAERCNEPLLISPCTNEIMHEKGNLYEIGLQKFRYNQLNIRSLDFRTGVLEYYFKSEDTYRKIRNRNPYIDYLSKLVIVQAEADYEEDYFIDLKNGVENPHLNVLYSGTKADDETSLLPFDQLATLQITKPTLDSQYEKKIKLYYEETSGDSGMYTLDFTDVFADNLKYNVYTEGPNPYPYLKDFSYNAGRDAGLNEGYSTGYEDGHNAGLNEGYNNGYNDGSNEGYNAGHDDGYNSGLDDGYEDGFINGLDEGFNNGYNLGLNDGQQAGYNDGYNDGYDNGFNDGMNNGFNDGYNNGFNDGQNMGYLNGRGEGYNEGFNDGYNNGRISGYTDGYISGYGNGYDRGRIDGSNNNSATDNTDDTSNTDGTDTDSSDTTDTTDTTDTDNVNSTDGANTDNANADDASSANDAAPTATVNNTNSLSDNKTINITPNLSSKAKTFARTPNTGAATPETTEQGSKVSFPWWLGVIFGLNAIILTWLFWPDPKRSEKNRMKKS